MMFSTVHHQGDPAKNDHIQHFMAIDNLLLPIFKAFPIFICSIHPTEEILDVFSLCVTSEVFFTLTNGSPSVLSIVNNLSAPRRTRLPLVKASYKSPVSVPLVRAVWESPRFLDGGKCLEIRWIAEHLFRE
jgi:hypothetical protein